MRKDVVRRGCHSWSGRCADFHDRVVMARIAVVQSWMCKIVLKYLLK